jgi:hypothetical protein
MNRNRSAFSTCAGSLKFLSLPTLRLIGIDDARKDPRRRRVRLPYGD